jgi:antitoxin VapB
MVMMLKTCSQGFTGADWGVYHRHISLLCWRIAVSFAAKLFVSGRSQAVRLPKSLRFEGAEVIAKRYGNGVLLLPPGDPWQLMREALEEFEPDFQMQREQPPEQQRETWLK